MTLPLAAFAQALALGSFVYLPNIYIDLFQGDATLIGLFSILVVPFDILIQPRIGKLSDRGFFNQGFLHDVNRYGRRAPLMFLSLPVLSVALFLGWVGPESLDSSIGVAVWYGVIRFLIAIGATMFETAALAAFTELLPSKRERARVALQKFVFGMLGGLIGAVGIGAGALAINEKGSPKQRSVFQLFGVVTAGVWLLAVPFGRVQTRTIMKKLDEEAQASSVWSSVTEVWRSSKSFRFFAIALHLFNGAYSLLLFVLPFYLKENLGYSDVELSQAIQLIIAGAGLAIPCTAPLVLYLSKRMEQSMMAGVGGLICIIVGGCHLNARFVIADYWTQVVQLGLVCGLGLGTVIVAWNLANAVLFKWIVDEDQVRRAEQAGVLGKAPGDRREILAEEIPARRDGIINSLRSCFGTSGLAWPGLFQVALGVAGYEGDQDTQPEAVRTLTLLTYTLFIPLMFLAFALPMLFYPMRGEALKRLQLKYATLYEKLADHSGRAGTPVQ